jgi:hypothetical protein
MGCTEIRGRTEMERNERVRQIRRWKHEDKDN